MRNTIRSKQLPELLAAPRYEVIPTKGIAEAVVGSLPRTATVTITASPVKGLDATLDLAEYLIGQGYQVVPHLSARLVIDESHLKDIVDRLVALRVDDVFVPAGDAEPPAGKYDGALGVLTALTEMGRPFGRVGIAGYPESHPAIDDDVTIQSMWDKRNHATYIVSNLCFDHRVLANWISRVRRRGVDLPIMVGVAGPVERVKLLRVAGKIGVGESTRFIRRHPSWLLRFAAPSGYNPSRLLERGAGVLAAPASKVAGLHIFTFNHIAETEAWRRSLTPQRDPAPA